MANLFFKRGKRSSLDNAPLRDGTIYVTTDERAMYVDYLPAATEQNPNPSVTRIRLGDFREYADFDAIMAIPTSQLDTSALYYAAAENILCKWTGNVNGDNSGWVQVNPQASLTALIKKVFNSATAITGGVQVSTQLRDKNNFGPTGRVSYVAGNSGLAITATNDTTNGTTTLTLTPEQIVESASLAVRTNQSTGDPEIVLTNTKTGTAADGTTVNTSTESVLNIAGEGISLVEDNGVLTFVNGGGVRSIANAFDSNGGFVTTLTLTGSSTRSSVAVTPIIQYGDTTQNAYFANGVAVLSVYTKAEVDARISNELRAINAMTFKGSVGDAAGSTYSDLPTTGVHNGDTYKVSSPGDYGPVDANTGLNLFQECRTGDMFIATGTEGNDGVISTANLSWTYIPSGNDDVQTFRFAYDSTNNRIKLVNAVGTTVSTLSAGSDISLTGSGTDMTVSHANVTRTDTTGTDQTQSSGSGDLEINVVTGVTTSATGHVTGIELTKLTIADEFNKLVALTVTSSVEQATGDALIGLDVADRLGFHASGNIRLHSDSLTFAAGQNGSTSIEMQWGSF